jgi:sugar O-acyltransferase (sialic acid O-acetyltransferase NeuD family)
MMETRLILVGAGNFGRELVNWAQDIAEYGGHGFHGYLDTTPDVLAVRGYKLPWLGTPTDYVPQPGDQMVIAIANPLSKRAVVEHMLAKGASFARLIHPTAVVARTASLGEGVVLCPHSVVSADSTVGNFVSVNTLSSVGHDVVLGDFSTLSGHVDLTGAVKVGVDCFFGTGAKVLPKVKIGNGAKIGAGTVIMRSVADGVTMYTAPAKRL